MVLYTTAMLEVKCLVRQNCQQRDLSFIEKNLCCQVSDCMQTLFRGNSLGSKIMAFCFKIYGHVYLQNLLEPLITALLDQADERVDISFEVDPARYIFLMITFFDLVY